MNFPELAIYLVAGRGSRLGDMTAEYPKCLIPINSVPLLTRSLRQLSRLGVKKVILVIGYRSGSFQDHYRSSYMGMEICYVLNPDWSTTNNLVSFDLAVPYIDTDYILLEGDLIYTDDAISRMHNVDSMAISPLQDHMDGTVVTLDEDHFVRMMYLRSTMVQHQGSEPLYKTVNIYCFSLSTHNKIVRLEVKRFLARGKHQSYYEEAFAEAIEQQALSMKAILFADQLWYEIDTREDLERAKDLFRNE